MEDLYRYLRALIGDTADLLGLERELNIRTGKIILDPPTSEEASGEIAIGKVCYGERELHQFGISRDMLTNHCLIAGRSGGTKTNTAFHIVASLMKQDIPFIIFDWKKTHRNLVSVFPSIKVFTVGRATSPFLFNPLIPPSSVHPKAWALALSQIWESGSLLGPGASHVLLKAFDHVYELYNIYDNPDAEEYPTMHDVLSYLESLDVRKFREAQWLSSAKRAVQAICFGDAGNALNVRKRSSVQDVLRLLNGHVVLELESLVHQVKSFFILSLLLWIHHYSLNTQERGKLKRVFIIEECHHLLSKQFHRPTASEDILENLLSESRELGNAFVTLFQSVSPIPHTVLSNVHTIICHNLVHERDINAMAASLLLTEKEKVYISQLQPGMAICKMQTKYTKPFLVHVPLFDVLRERILTDVEIRKQNAGFSPNSPPSHTADKRTETSSPDSPISISDDELAFLLSVLKRPFSATSTRYKELGFYMKKGNAVKSRLITLGIMKNIPIQIANNRTVKLCELTDKGKHYIATLGYSPRYDFDAKGGLEHAFWVYRITNELKRKGYVVQLEEKGVDIIATKDSHQVAVEVETGRSYPAKNILKCIQFGFPRIISVATNQETLSAIRRFITHSNLDHRVTVVLAREFAEDPSQLSL